MQGLHTQQIRQYLSPVLQESTLIFIKRFKEESFTNYLPCAGHCPTKPKGRQGSALQTQNNWGLRTPLQQSFHSNQQPWCQWQKLASPIPKRERESVPAGQQRVIQENDESDRWHTSQYPPNPRLPGQAMLTPLVMTKLERIEKVYLSTWSVEVKICGHVKIYGQGQLSKKFTSLGR